jgi:hypothetical protein
MRPQANLATLLIEEGGVIAERLDEALQRRVLSGGGLDTVVLEMGLVDEEAMLRLLSRSEGLPAVGKPLLDQAAADAVVLFPRRLAEKNRMVPLSLEGRHLSVAVARAPDRALLDELGFMLSLNVRPFVTIEARIGYALCRRYGVPLPARIAKLLGMLGEDPDDLAPLSFSAPVDEPAKSLVEEGGWTAVSARYAVPAGEGQGLGQGQAAAASELLGGAAPPGRALPSGATSPPGEARLHLLARLDEEDVAERAREERRRKERVAWTVDDAITEIALADERDAMLDVLLRFAYRRLRTVAIFVLQRHATKESKRGLVLWDLIHPEKGLKEVAPLVLDAEGTSTLAQLCDMRSHFLGPLQAGDPLATAFGERPRATVLVPILVGDVLAGVLYGDGGDKAIPPSSLAELHMVVPRLGQGLHNLIVRKKRAEASAASPLELRMEPKAEAHEVPVIEVDLEGLNELAGLEPATSGFMRVQRPVELIDEPPQKKKRRSNLNISAPVEDAEALLERKGVAQATPPPLPKRKQAQAAAVPAASPGAAARESLLLATWRDWLRCEDNDTDELLGDLQQPDAVGRLAITAIVARGDGAMPSLARYFPGVLSVHPFSATKARPHVAELSDACACLSRLGADRAAPVLVGELDHADRLHRYTAVWCLSTLKVPAALPRLAQRVFDPELRIALLALEVLDGYRHVPGYEKILGWLREFCRRGDVFERKRAILAASELSDAFALEHLVNLLGTRPKEVADEARQALTDITLQDFSFSERRWRAWIAENQGRPRTAWLIDGLGHNEAAIRERAQRELNRVTGETLGYRHDDARKDREAATRAWNAWWQLQPLGRWP